MYAPSCDGGAMSIIHGGLRVPALGFSGIVVGLCFLLYPATVTSAPTPGKSDQAVVTCPYGGEPTKLKTVAPDGTEFKYWCPEDLSELPELLAHYRPIIPYVPAD